MNIPNHVAIILDGNGRWAKSKGMPRNYGHVKGAQNLEVICRDAYNMGIKYLTVYLFSTENWKRSPDEVDALMKLFRRYTKTCIRTARDNNMKVRVLGDPTALADGQIVARWREKDGKVELMPFENIGARTKKRIEREVEKWFEVKEIRWMEI